jgi:hypothetical protein
MAKRDEEEFEYAPPITFKIHYILTQNTEHEVFLLHILMG